MYLAAWAAFSFAAWSSLYMSLSWFNSARSSEWNCRVVTAFHGILSFAVASWSAFVTGPFPLRQDAVGGKNNFLHEVAMIICFGYFLFDFIWCLSMQTEGPLMLLHHLTCIVGLSVSLSWGVSGTESVATIVGSEITNPFLQARWFLKQTGGYDGRLGRCVDVAFVLLFVVVRIGIGAALFYVSVWSSPNVTLFFKLGGTSLYAISLVFLGQILQFAYRKLSGIKRPGSGSKAASAANGTRNGAHNGATKRKAA